MVRQNELIEAGLTHQFDSIDVDMSDMCDRAAAMGKKFACQFLKSAAIPVACFDVPLDIGAPADAYSDAASQIPTIVELASEIGAVRCRLEVGGSGFQVYHENFELVRQRIADLADAMEPAKIQFGLMLQRDPSQSRHDRQFIQKADELLTLIKVVGRPSVGLALDTCTWSLAGGSLAELKKLSPSQLVDVQLCDPAPGTDWQSAEASGRCLPSTADDSLAVQAVRWLAKAGYDGPLAVTAHPSQVAEAQSSAIGARLADTLNEILAKAGVVAAPAEEVPAG
jgi:sugar phosphate isomerase/epimerase